MDSKISVVINTLNEEENIERAIKSVKWADEILVCDMHSEDETVGIAKKLGAKILFHNRENCVEPARNFAVSKASNDWVLVADPDEEIPPSLTERLRQIAASMKQIDYVRIPRKNLIFGRFLKYCGWWPDLNIRFFKKGKVKWGDQIHRPPEVSGQGLNLSAKDEYAIIHHHYSSISQYITRMDRYTSVQASELIKEGYIFEWKDIFEKPLSEFLSRFFASQGYKDGLHGLVLSFLQAFSCLIVYLKLWEINKFKEQAITLDEVQNQKDQMVVALDYWFKKSKSERSFLGKLFKR